MDFNKPLSRDEAILQNILGAQNVLSDPQSEIEAILQAILNDTPYTEEGRSRIASLLIAIKNKGVPFPELDTLNVTENGTYTAEEGRAYDKVNVNVPLPENAYLLKSATDGDIVTFTDGANLPMPSLKLGINPQQEGSGDPSPTNIRPIIGHTEANVSVSGVNIYDGQWEVGGIRTADGTPVSASAVRSKEYIRVPMGEKLYFFIPATIYIYYYDSAKNYKSYISIANSAVVTPPQGTKYVKYQLTGVYGTTYNNDISINYPSTDTQYHAYNGQTYTIDLDGTRYGGTLDVVSGELVVDRIKWTLTPTASQIAGVNISDCRFYIPADKTPVDWNVSVNKCMCNKLKVSNFSAQHDNHIHFPNSSTIALFLEDEVGTTKQDWVDYLAQAQIDVSYIIATPLTIQLTPTQVKSLLGSNNVWCDTGKIEELEYFSKA